MKNYIQLVACIMLFLGQGLSAGHNNSQTQPSWGNIIFPIATLIATGACLTAICNYFVCNVEGNKIASRITSSLHPSIQQQARRPIIHCLRIGYTPMRIRNDIVSSILHRINTKLVLSRLGVASECAIQADDTRTQNLYRLKSIEESINDLPVSRQIKQELQSILESI